MAAGIDRHDPAFAEKLKQVLPNGIEVSFENAGGIVFAAVLPLLNDRRLIANYNDTVFPTRCRFSRARY